MAHEVWPLEPGERVWLRTFNGFGCDMKGFTRPDDTGRYFGTRWITVAGLPLVPLDRLYLAEVSSSGISAGVYSEWTTRYEIVGRTRLHFGEIVRTVLFCWLFAPAFVLVPVIALLSKANDLNIWLVLGGFVGWLIASVCVLAFLLTRYRSQWAPVRPVEWAVN